MANIPQPFSANVRLPVEAAGAGAQVANSVSRGVEILADSADQAYQRIQTRQDAVNLTRSINDYEQNAYSEYRRLTTEADFADPSVAQGFAAKLKEQQDALLKDWSGSDNAKVRLYERLDGIRGGLADQAAVQQITEGRRMVANQITEITRNLADAAYKDPGAMAGLFNRLDTELQDFAPAITQEDFQTAQEAGRQLIVTGAANHLLDRGNVDGAEEILSVPGVIESLDANTARGLRTRIATQRTELTRAQMAGQAKVQEFTSILGREPTAQERLRLAGMAPTSSARTLADKVSEYESVLGRPASEAEISKMAGADVEPTAGYSFGKGMQGIALANLTNESATFSAGMMSPEQERNFESSVVAYMTPQRDPDTGVITQPILPPHVNAALSARGYKWDLNDGALIPPGGMTMAERANSGMIGQTAPGATPFPQSAAQAATQAEPQASGQGTTEQSGPNVWDMADDLTGIGPAIVNKIGETPLVGDSLVNEKITRAKATIKPMQDMLVRILQTSPRYAETERQSIADAISIEGKMFDNPTAFRNRLIGIDDALQVRQDFAYKTANNPNVGREERIQAMNILNGIVEFRQNLGIPPRVQSAQDWNNIQDGAQYIDPAGQIRVKGGKNGGQ